MSFPYRMEPAPMNGGFCQRGWWTWCGSVIQGDDGRYHMFASRWPRGMPFGPYWVTNSEIVRAASETPEGPYVLEEIVLGPRDPSHWDGRMTHNPTIHRAPDGTFLLFYTGSSYPFTPPSPADLSTPPDGIGLARANQRIGLATAKSVLGPWRRPEEPILHPRPGQWDALMTTNPAPCVLEDGTVYLAYKSTGHQKDLLRYGMVRADRYDTVYERILASPVFTFEDGCHIEDAYLWRQDGVFQVLLKDMTGGIGGELHGGVHATSPDAVNWTFSDPPTAYSRTVQWQDGSVTRQGSLERPQLLIENGEATHLFAATCDGPGHFKDSTRSWNMCIPLARR